VNINDGVNVKRFFVQSLLVSALVLSGYTLAQASSFQGKGILQIPTVAVATVTGTPAGPIATVRNNGEQDQINVRSGPGTIGYDIIGVLIVGQQVPALGRTPGGDWIEIAYPGVPGGVAWVYTPLVEVSSSLPIVEPPPTPTPRVTPTIDPTMAAQFQVDLPPTRLPTYTPPPPLNIPTFPAQSPASVSGRIPMGLVIIGMAVVGLFGTLISFLRGR
jgi:hypothetical protein